MPLIGRETGAVQQARHDGVLDSCPACLLVPAARGHITAALNSLKMAPLLYGYRGKPCVNFDAILDAIDAVQSYVLANKDSVEEVEINPLICTAQTAVAVDALIRKTQ